MMHLEAIYARLARMTRRELALTALGIIFCLAAIVIS
jgi:hypothetical protein